MVHHSDVFVLTTTLLVVRQGGAEKARDSRSQETFPLWDSSGSLTFVLLRSFFVRLEH